MLTHIKGLAYPLFWRACTRYAKARFPHPYQGYSENPDPLLASLCDKYGSDKGSVGNRRRHTYTHVYGLLFQHCREGVRRVFECGIGTNNLDVPCNMGAAGVPGASLRVWRDYFPAARIFGADIDRDILFQEERITTHSVDQTSPASIRQMWREIGEPDFQLMIDDGLHTVAANMTLFENSHQQLSPSGIYVMEDVNQRHWSEYQKAFQGADFSLEFVECIRPRSARFLPDNSLILIRKRSRPVV